MDKSLEIICKALEDVAESTTDLRVGNALRYLKRSIKAIALEYEELDYQNHKEALEDSEGTHGQF